MEKKQGFFSTLKKEVVRGLSPTNSRSKDHDEVPTSPGIDLLHPRRRKERLGKHSLSNLPEPFMGRFRSFGETLAPLMEEPPYAAEACTGDSQKDGWSKWVLGQLSRVPSVSTSYAAVRSDIRLLLGVMGAPLAPAYVSSVDTPSHVSIKDTPIVTLSITPVSPVLLKLKLLPCLPCQESSSAQYILRQYTAATGGLKLQISIRSAYAIGKLRMATKATKSRAARVENGGFVLWQMAPDNWYVELAVGGNKVRAGCNGKLVWRHTPWLGSHAAKGPVRPLRRALQGLDPLTTACMYVNARCIGEKKVNGEDCFVLKHSADPQTLKARSDGTGEIIRHALFGYFSQKTGLLIHMEDSHLTRIQSSSGADAVYWETTISSFMSDYRAVEGVMIAHSGRSIVTLFRFGETAMSHNKTRMEEAWTIEEVVFNVPGLSADCFIPPADIRCRANQQSTSSNEERSQRVAKLKLGVLYS